MRDQSSYHRRRRPAGDRYPGVWFRVGADGTKLYEVTWYDSEGRRRWRRVEGGLKDAIAAREELRGKTRRGERVGSSRLKFAEVSERYFDSATNLRPRTRDKYAETLRLHVTPRLGRRPIASITEDDLGAWGGKGGQRVPDGAVG